ncbi:hypothetical protein B296_00032542 [Ensete ventricosum]|uniref:Uncharacterized protein n=1 Tax=Ensete ventricosum TaxID=4639 RepID=A0A426Y652_ENSVE|nr:hypothetical protein B296_00032542 [Ensete ventricosum]
MLPLRFPNSSIRAKGQPATYRRGQPRPLARAADHVHLQGWLAMAIPSTREASHNHAPIGVAGCGRLRPWPPAGAAARGPPTRDSPRGQGCRLQRRPLMEEDMEEEVQEHEEEVTNEEQQPIDITMHALTGYANPQTIKVD